MAVWHTLSCYENNIRDALREKNLKERFACGGHAQRDMFYALLRFQHVREPLHLFGFSPDGDDLQAVVMVEMDVLSRDDHGAEAVLDVHEAAGELTSVMVIGHGDSASDIIPFGPLLFYQFLSYQVPNGLGSVTVVVLLDMLVELVYQPFIQGNAESVELAHFCYIWMIFSDESVLEMNLIIKKYIWQTGIKTKKCI